MAPLRPVLLVLALAVAGCRGEGPSAALGADEAARIGASVLTEDEVREQVRGAVAAGLDSADARRRTVDQWVTDELLVQEARRQGVPDRADVRRRLAEGERAVLAASLVEGFFEANPAVPDEAAIVAYFNAHRDALALREPYVRVRHLVLPTADRAEAARRALAALAPADSAGWAGLVRRHATDADGALALSRAYLPESRLLATDQALALPVRALQPGATSAVLPSTGPDGPIFHVVQLLARVPAGSAARLDWVRAELTDLLAIETRKEMLARQVQALKSEAQARGDLVLRE